MAHSIAYVRDIRTFHRGHPCSGFLEFKQPDKCVDDCILPVLLPFLLSHSHTLCIGSGVKWAGTDCASSIPSTGDSAFSWSCPAQTCNHFNVEETCVLRGSTPTCVSSPVNCCSGTALFLTIDSTVLQIPSDNFVRCRKVTTITFLRATSLQSIGISAFNGMTGIVEVSLRNSNMLRTIGAQR